MKFARSHSLPRPLHLPPRLVAVLALFATLLGAHAAPAHEGDDEAAGHHSRRLSVQGTGEMKAAPDMAQINLGVVSEAETAAEALQQNNQAMNRLLTRLKKHGVAEEDIQTTNFNVSPQYDRKPPRENRSQQIIGYRVANQVQAVIRSLPSLGDILDDVVQGGANQINGIQFLASNEEKLLDQARRKAVQDARRKADLLAQAAGVKLARVLRIDENAQSVPRPMQYRMSTMASAESVPIEAGQQKFRADINVIYALEDSGNERDADESNGDEPDNGG